MGSKKVQKKCSEDMNTWKWKFGSNVIKNMDTRTSNFTSFHFNVSKNQSNGLWMVTFNANEQSRNHYLKKKYIYMSKMERSKDISIGIALDLLKRSGRRLANKMFKLVTSRWMVVARLFKWMVFLTIPTQQSFLIGSDNRMEHWITITLEK